MILQEARDVVSLQDYVLKKVSIFFLRGPNGEDEEESG